MKIFKIASGFGFTLFFISILSSCRKYYTCNCNKIENNETEQINIFLFKEKNQQKAEEKCVGAETNPQYFNCKAVEE